MAKGYRENRDRVETIAGFGTSIGKRTGSDLTRTFSWIDFWLSPLYFDPYAQFNNPLGWNPEKIRRRQCVAGHEGEQFLPP